MESKKVKAPSLLARSHFPQYSLSVISLFPLSLSSPSLPSLSHLAPSSLSLLSLSRHLCLQEAQSTSVANVIRLILQNSICTHSYLWYKPAFQSSNVRTPTCATDLLCNRSATELQQSCNRTASLHSSRVSVARIIRSVSSALANAFLFSGKIFSSQETEAFLFLKDPTGLVGVILQVLPKLNLVPLN